MCAISYGMYIHNVCTLQSLRRAGGNGRDLRGSPSSLVDMYTACASLFALELSANDNGNGCRIPASFGPDRRLRRIRACAAPHRRSNRTADARPVTTALELARRPAFSSTAITVLDRLPVPAADGSSIDSSRIVRPDYSDAAYARLCSDAQAVWRGTDPAHPLHGIGDDGRYTETGLVLTAEAEGMAYVDASFATVSALQSELGAGCALELLTTREDVARVCRTGGGALGVRGYANWSSGWADAEGAVRFLRAAVEKTRKVVFATGEAARLVEEDGRVVGVRLTDGTQVGAELTVLAAGAWTPRLVDLGGRSVATGQVLGYLPLSAEEWESVSEMPVVFNLSTGGRLLRARLRPLPEPADTEKRERHLRDRAAHRPRPQARPARVGLPQPHCRHGRSHGDHPHGLDSAHGRDRCRTRGASRGQGRSLGRAVLARAAIRRQAAVEHSALLYLPFPLPLLSAPRLLLTHSATGDFIVTHHPTKAGLFLATGGSGHAFKFLPVIGGHIADILERKTSARFASKWAWPREAASVVTRDGSRGDGGVQLVLEVAAGTAAG